MRSIRKKTIEDINVSGKKVIVRVDFNVPFDEQGNISNDQRIIGALKTIKYLLQNEAKVILVSHLGRPTGFDMKFSMIPIAKRLSELLDNKIIMSSDVVGDDSKTKAASLKSGQILMLENVRFHKEEIANDPDFARKLASLAEIFVNDAFGTSHRAHASTAGLADYLPAVSGFLIKKEIEFLGNVLDKPERPFVAILGGAKVSDKIGVIEAFLDKVDILIIGGGMAYTFLRAKGYRIGDSICEYDKVELAKKLMEKAEKKGVRILLPIGSIVGNKFINDTDTKYVPSDDMPDGWKGMDIGSLTVEKYAQEIRKAKTIVWNGPMGVFEFPNFAEGTRAIAKAVAEADAISIVGGGDSAAALEQLGYGDRITHISTGGGAALEFMEGKELPGIACLEDLNPRKKVIAGNWKMNKTPSESVEYINEFSKLVSDSKVDVIIAVPFVCITAALEAAKGTNIQIAAQNMHWEESGAYTGEISGKMLKEIGVKYVIIGHSERRQYFGDTDATVNRKAHAAFNNDLIPVICVGESLNQREDGVTKDFIRVQVRVVLRGISKEQAGSLIIAYEPIWAIGTGKTASSEQAEEVCAIIREMAYEMFDEEVAEKVRIQYGGSVNPTNAQELFNMNNIDGGLVGGASVKVDDFEKIVNYD